MPSDYSFKSVGIDEIADLTRLFEGRGGPHYCWCTLWRLGTAHRSKDKAIKKTCLLEAIFNGIHVGLLAYDRAKPIGWCSVGPRDSFRPLGGVEALRDVWSIVCFYVKRSYRHRGISRQLLEQATAYARKHQAQYLEAYAAAEGTTSYRFMGYVPMYQEAGFEYIKMAGKRRHVMLKQL